ncbi:MAG: DUF4124 domain-containing protein [Desulfobacterales bacterium]|nr:DUF4124 domain-containing protein [Desulfobacterales bacterium]
MDTGHKFVRKVNPLMRFKNLVPSVLIACLAATTASMAVADIYSWTDADGVRHYSNKPPHDDVPAARRSGEIAYDAEADEKVQAAERRYFDQRAMENTIRRLEKTERALNESLERAREAKSRDDQGEEPLYSDDDGYDYDDPYYWGTYYGGDYGGYVDDYDRGRRFDRDRRQGRRDRGGRNGRDKGWQRGRKGDDSKEARIRRHRRIGRQRLSKRERGVRSGLTRVVRAVPSPYYMGYRPVYAGGSDSSYESRRGRQGHRAYRRGGGGGFRGGGRGRVGF